MRFLDAGRIISIIVVILMAVLTFASIHSDKAMQEMSRQGLKIEADFSKAMRRIRAIRDGTYQPPIRVKIVDEE